MFATDRLRRAESALIGARAWASRPKNRRWLLLIAFAIFAVLAIISFRNLPEGVELRPWFMVAIAASVLSTTWLLNALEYRSIAKAAGHRVTFDTAVQVSLAASVANLLPAPGGVAVRTAALKLEGSSVGSALSVNAVAGMIWIGATAVLVGLALLTDPAFTARGAAVITAGAIVLVGSIMALRRLGPPWRRVFVELLAIETCIALAAALRVGLAFAAIGQPVSIAAAVTIASATVLAAAIGVFPAGLGLREALAAGLAVTVQASAAVAVAASAVERVSALAGKALYVPALGLYLRSVARRRVGDDDSALVVAAELDAQATTHPAATPASSPLRDPDRPDD
jgi:uncharacterized membrane protein YbhN (UPF0104 family)